jgi:hypothetical protein
LPFAVTRAIHVIAAVITAQGASMTTITEQTETTSNSTAAEPKATKKPRVGARVAPVATKKPKSGKKASPAKKAPKTAAKPKGTGSPEKAAKEKGVREGSKTETILALLKRPGGVTAKEPMKATSWQPHSVRGFLSGIVGKRMGLTVTSTKGEGGERTYSV